MVRDEAFYAGAKYCARIGALARVHAENGPVIKELQRELLSQGITGPEGHWLSRPEEVFCHVTYCVLPMLTALFAGRSRMREASVRPFSTSQMPAVHRQRDVEESCERNLLVSSPQHVVFGQTTAAGLALSAQHGSEEDLKFLAAYVTSPPIRKDPRTPSILMDALSR